MFCYKPSTSADSRTNCRLSFHIIREQIAFIQQGGLSIKVYSGAKVRLFIKTALTNSYVLQHTIVPIIPIAPMISITPPPLKTIKIITTYSKI
jgi:hypothetical protein